MDVVIEKVKAVAGENIVVPVEFNNVPEIGINNCDFILEYDESVLEFENAEAGIIIPDAQADFKSYSVGGKIYFLYNDSLQGSNQIVNNGIFAKITFKVIKSATAGTYNISKYSVGAFSGMVNNKLTPIGTEFANGSITVESSTPVPSTTPTPTKVVVESPNNPGGPIAVTTPTATATATPTTASVATATPTATPIIVVEPTKSIPGYNKDADLAVFISSDKSRYEESSIITYSIEYKNIGKVNATNVKIVAQIPKFTKVYDAAKGAVNGSEIVWTIGNLASGETYTKEYKVKVDSLTKSEEYTDNTVVISSDQTVDIPADVTTGNDDKSTIRVMLYSNRFTPGSHSAYILGYTDKTFKPTQNVTRAEVAAMFARIMGITVKDDVTSSYKDVSNKHWALKYIEAVTKSGIFKGYKDSTFHPNAPITRAELSTVIFNYLHLNNIAPSKVHFNDINEHWAKNFIEEIYRFKLIQGYSDGSFKPNNNITRAEVVTMINRMLYRGPLKVKVGSFPDVSVKYWAFGDIEEASRDHKYTRDEKDGSEILVE